jgi:hypothetical protein
MDKHLIFGNIKIENIETPTYSGNIESFDFAFQKNNYDKIKQNLEKIGYRLDYVISKTYKALYCENYLTKFIAFNEAKNVVWYKYEGKRLGVGQNMIYINSKKIKVTDFIKMADNELDNICCT